MNIKMRFQLNILADHIKKEKIKVSDGIKALTTLIKYRFIKMKNHKLK